jgi:ABC-type uncharacterized transport system permease subunit
MTNHIENFMRSVEFWHILLALFSYSVFGLAALQAVALSVQLTLLRDKPSHGLLAKLPPIETMQNLMFVFISLGFAGLTIAIVLGLVFFEQGGHLVLGKGSFTLFAWAVYACLLLSHFKLGLKLRLGILWTILAWLGLTLAYFGSKLVS